MASIQASTFNITAAQRALGIRSPIVNPDFSPEIVQTVQMADVSKSFAAEAFEARAVGTTGAAAAAATELHAIAPGGIVIERLTLSERVVPPVGIFIEVRATSNLNAVSFISNKMDVGGSLTNSTLRQSILPGPGVLPNFVRIETDPDGFFDLSDISWFVPAGNFLTCSIQAPAVDLYVEVQWREIPQPQGAQ